MSKEKAARKHGTSANSIRRWQQELKARGALPGAPEAGTPAGQDSVGVAAQPLGPAVKPQREPHPSLTAEVRQAIRDWRTQYPYMGPSQIRGQLRRFDNVRLSVKLVRRVLLEEGFKLETGPAAREEKQKWQRFEMERPNQLWQTDIVDFLVGPDRVYVMFLVDDCSRYIVDYDLYNAIGSAEATALLVRAIKRHGRPERLLSDRGGQYCAFRGLTEFARYLEDLDIDQSTAASYHPQTCGKVEAVNRALTRELLEVRHFFDRMEARRELTRWVRFYNEGRTHLSVDGLTPADRYFGRMDEVHQQLLDAVATGNAPADNSPWLFNEEGSRPQRAELLRFLVGEDGLEIVFLGKRFRVKA
jgi:transposase InsO family protein